MKILFFVFVFLFCKKTETPEVYKTKPEISVLAISGVQIQNLTIDFDLEYFGKGKVLSFIENKNEVSFFLIKDFDVLYQFPNKKTNCVSDLKINKVEFDKDKNLITEFNCKNESKKNLDNKIIFQNKKTLFELAN